MERSFSEGCRSNILSPGKVRGAERQGMIGAKSRRERRDSSGGIALRLVDLPKVPLGLGQSQQCLPDIGARVGVAGKLTVERNSFARRALSIAVAMVRDCDASRHQ